jgi:hypothetical protein
MPSSRARYCPLVVPASMALHAVASCAIGYADSGLTLDSAPAGKGGRRLRGRWWPVAISDRAAVAGACRAFYMLGLHPREQFGLARVQCSAVVAWDH